MYVVDSTVAEKKEEEKNPFGLIIKYVSDFLYNILAVEFLWKKRWKSVDCIWFICSSCRTLWQVDHLLLLEYIHRLLMLLLLDCFMPLLKFLCQKPDWPVTVFYNIQHAAYYLVFLHYIKKQKEFVAVGKFCEDKFGKICCLLCLMWCMTDIKENRTVYNVMKSHCWLHTTLCCVIIVFVFKTDIHMFTCSVWLFLRCSKFTQFLFLNIGFNTVEMKTSEPDQRLPEKNKGIEIKPSYKRYCSFSSLIENISQHFVGDQLCSVT